MSPIYRMRPLKYRAIWISDVHLGYKRCKADFLLDFLRATEADFLYLVGDIVDLWATKRSLFWPQAHNNVIRTILGKAKHGIKVIYIPGNHDDQIRDYCGITFGNFEIHEEYEHTTADGRRIRMRHGDKYDAVIRCNPLAGRIGTFVYDTLLYTHRMIDRQGCLAVDQRQQQHQAVPQHPVTEPTDNGKELLDQSLPATAVYQQTEIEFCGGSTANELCITYRSHNALTSMLVKAWPREMSVQ